MAGRAPRVDLASLEQALWSTAAVVFYLPVANGSVLYLEMVYGEYTVVARTIGFSPVRDAAIGLGVGVALATLLVGLARLPVGERMFRALRTRQGPWSRGMGLAVGAIGEELLFRAVLQPLLGWWPVVGVFALVHVPWRRDLWPWPLTALVSGAALGGCFAVTGAVLAGVVAQLVVGWTTWYLIDAAWRPPEPAGGGER